MNRTDISILALLLVLSPLVSSADDWPQFRGPQRDAHWREDGIASELPAGQLPRKWTARIAAGYSGPTVSQGRVFVTDRMSQEIQTGDGDQERVLCFDAKSGQPLWEYAYDAPYTISYRAGPRAAVTIDGQLAYAVGAMGHFHCLNVADGSVVWERDLNAQYAINMPIWGIAAAPFIHEQLVIQQLGGSDGASVVAFDKTTGEEVWRALDDRVQYSTPTLIQQAGRDVLVCWTGDSITALDPLEGTQLWRFPFPPSKMPIGIATPVVSDQRLFVSSFYDGSVLVRTPKDRIDFEVLWKRVGSSEQDTDALQSIISNPMFLGDYIYGVDSYGELRCLDAANGDRLWEDRSVVKPNRWATVHMVQHGQRTWMFNEQGELLVTELSPSGVNILSRSSIIAPTRIQLARRDEGVSWAPPAYANRSIYVRSDSELVCCSLAEEDF